MCIWEWLSARGGGNLQNHRLTRGGGSVAWRAFVLLPAVSVACAFIVDVAGYAGGGVIIAPNWCYRIGENRREVTACGAYRGNRVARRRRRRKHGVVPA